MKPESIVYAVAGTFFGLIVGWIIGTQQAQPIRVATPSAQAEAAAPAGNAPAAAKPVLDESQAQALRTTVEGDPRNADARVKLANLYFDAERYPEAIRYYEEALKLNPKNPEVSTDLGVSYYYLNQPDKALQQFDYSLGIDATHLKTLLNQGIVRAFGKQDLAGAIAAWEQVVKLSPNSPEGQTAKRALDSLKAAHPGGTMPATPPGGSTGG
jgi:tetratricopeptide (TPR) repeat protein